MKKPVAGLARFGDRLRTGVVGDGVVISVASFGTRSTLRKNSVKPIEMARMSSA